MGASRRSTAPKSKEPVKPKVETSAICIEAESGLVVSEENADMQRPPASMIKMMLMLLVTEGIRDGKWTLDTPINVTRHSETMGGTQVYLKEGESFTVGQLMPAVAVASANDAAMAVAEGLWGSEEAYLKRMNERAQELGMVNSEFRSVHGLPPDKGEELDKTTARDMSRLAQFCVLNPQILQWTSTKEMQLRPENAVAYNTNKMLWNCDGCDGIKTGFIRSAGFCVTATAKRDGIRLIAVIMGMDGNHERFDVAEKMLDDAFARVCRTRLIAKGETLSQDVPVANCEVPKVRLTAAEDLWVIAIKDNVDKIQILPRIPSFLKPPLVAGTQLGTLDAEYDGKTIGTVPLTSPVELTEAGWRWKLLSTVPSNQ